MNETCVKLDGVILIITPDVLQVCDSPPGSPAGLGLYGANQICNGFMFDRVAK